MAPEGLRRVTAAELAGHAKDGDCWIAVHGRVFDVSDFLREHPGGKRVILQEAGRDATLAFQAVHAQGILKHLPRQACIGELPADELELLKQQEPKAAASETAGEAAPAGTMTLEQVLNLNDFELAASQKMDRQGYGYYASAANDEVTKRDNQAAFARAWLRPRVLRNVEEVDTSCMLLGCPSSFPVFISPAAMAGLAHPDGELALARAAGAQGVIQVVAHMASRELEHITAERVPGQVQWFQAYINPVRSKTEDVVRRAEAAGCRALLVTVDTAVLGRRERDMRNKVTDTSNLSLAVQGDLGTRAGGVAQALGRISDPSFSWEDLAWLRAATGLPLVLKGIQTGEDAVLAAQSGVAGILVSNHGGRNLDHARPSLDALAEIVAALEEAGLKDKLEVYLDGGVRRGTDVYKALALGAKAVGIGRPAMYSLVFGQEGTEKCLRLLHEELVMCMRLMGVRSLAEISGRDVAFRPATALAWAGPPAPGSRL